MTANKSVSRRSLGSDLARVAAHVIQPGEYQELPELTDDMLARGKVNRGGRPRSGSAGLAFISFWAKPAPPPGAAHVKRWASHEPPSCSAAVEVS